MNIVQIGTQDIKILYSPSQERVRLGEIFKITDVNSVLISQVYEIASQQGNPSFNTAGLKIMFSLQNGRWSNWNGEVPSANADIQIVDKDELLKELQLKNISSGLKVGTFSQYDNVKFVIPEYNLPASNVIFTDRQDERTDFSVLFASELVDCGRKVVIVDAKGEYADIEIVKLKAGTDLKLSLNAKGIDRIYSKGFEGASPESRAIIEDVFIEVRNYARTCEDGFIPFSSFKDVVDDTYEQMGITQLILLKNRLLKYEQAGLFADTSNEINALSDSLLNNDVVIVDLSEIPVEWHKDFVDNIVSMNIDKYNQQFVLVFEANSENFDIPLLNKLFVKGIQSGITPVLSVGYGVPFVENILSFAKNLYLFKPMKTLSIDFQGVFSYVSKLNEKEFIICGETTKFIPLFVNLNEDTFTKEQEEMIVEKIQVAPSLPKEEYKAVDEFEVSPVVDAALDIALETAQIVDEDINDDFDFEEEVQDSSDFDQIVQDNVSEDEYNDEFLDIAEEIVHENEEIVEFEEDNYSFDEQDIKDIDFGDEQDVKHNIAKDVDELYKRPKEEPAPEIIAPSPAPSLSTKLPVYSANYESEQQTFKLDIEEGDMVRHQKYGTGVVKKIICYGNKNLCSIHFNDVGRRLLDPELAVIEKI